MNQLPPKRISTSEYPTRYEAFVIPRTLIENSKTPGDRNYARGGYEYAVYYEPVMNKAYPHIEDGIYAAIVGYQDIDYLLDCSATRPTHDRARLNESKHYATYEAARVGLYQWLYKARKFCGIEVQDAE